MKMLVIRLKYIGDSLLALPVLKAIRKEQPEAEIHYLLYEHVAPLHYQQDYVDHVQVITAAEKNNPYLYFKKLKVLRAEKYDVVIDLLTVPVTVIISRFMGAKTTIGFDKGKWRSRFYSKPVKQIPNISSAKQKLALLKYLPEPIHYPIEKGNMRNLSIFNMDIQLQKEELENAQAKLQAMGIDCSKPILLFCCIARQKQKLWPADNYIELINKCLAENPAFQVLCIWGPGEKSQVNAIVEKVSSLDVTAKVFLAEETKDVRELAAISYYCDLYIGNDTGPRHIAEAVGTSTFTIFSPYFDKSVWLLDLNKKNQAIGLTDVLDINHEDFLLAENEIRQEAERYYKYLNPEVVFEKLQPMLQAIK